MSVAVFVEVKSLGVCLCGKPAKQHPKYRSGRVCSVNCGRKSWYTNYCWNCGTMVDSRIHIKDTESGYYFCPDCGCSAPPKDDK